MKLALVTGGCHRLGAHIAGRLAGAGYAVALHGREAADPEPVLLKQLQWAGVPWHGFAADLADEEDVARLPKAVEQHFGANIDLLINNASLFGADMTSLVEHFRINAAAPFALTMAIAERARAAGKGAAVVNILDQRIVHPHSDQLAYTVSKQALAEVTRTLAATLAPHVRVCAVAPGLTVPTDDYSAEQIARLAEMMPLRRLPTPDDVSDAIIYLAGAQATTGQTIFVDGGASLTRFDRDFVHLGREE